jgi:SNF2 family DNA or RNA helicase
MEALFSSDRHLYPFQEEFAAKSYLMPTTLLNMDTGVGKGVIALAVASLLLEDDLIDIVLLVCEKNKLADAEWPKEIATYTTIDWKRYEGTPKKRAKIREDLPQLLLAGYDIVKNDSATFPKNARGNKMAPVPGPLIEVLEGKRVLVIYDETSALANRTSQTHKAHKLLIECLRQTEGFRLLVLTATPMEKDPVSYYNLARILSPETCPTVNDFEHRYVSSFDIYRNPYRFKNLHQQEEPGVIPLKTIMGHITLRKRKSDPDVAGFFPKRREMPPTFVGLSDLQQNFYNAVEDLTDGLTEVEQRAFGPVLRQIAGHPAALLASDGAIARGIVETVTPEGILAIPSAKTVKMVEWCKTVVREQGAQAVIFTFFAHQIMPLLQSALVDEGFSVTINHGQLSTAARSEAQREFRAGESQIFLTSDAGQKGINLPEATYLLHYERPPTHANFIQRSDRIHRIDSLAESVFIYSLVAANTIEEGFYNLGLRRNDWSDKLQGDDEVDNVDFISADDRKELFKMGRKAHNGKR